MAGPKRDLARSVEYFRSFLVERTEPARLYGLMARDVVATLESYTSLDGRVVADIGGGPGYVAEALASAGAHCVTVDYAMSELHLHDRLPIDALVGDGQRLPFRSEGFDVVHSANVLEHVPEPRRFISEMIRSVRPGGVIYLGYTPWFSPWGGHELSPWHYLGAERAIRRYESRGGTVKNRPGTSLFRTGVGEVLGWIHADDRVEVLSESPRYYPWWTAPMLRVPGVREVFSWNVEIVMRRVAGSSSN